MLRIVLLPLLLFTISMACMGQTFQYSRGWTNGKRSLGLDMANALSQQRQQQQQRYLQREEFNNNIPAELYDDPIFERYFLQMPRSLRNALLGRSTLYGAASNIRPTVPNANSNIDTNNKNDLFGSHHASNDLFDEMNNAVESNDYSKH